MTKAIEFFFLSFAVLIVSGCQSESERLAGFAERSVQQQATQNQEMAKLNSDVAEALQSVSSDQLQSRKEYTDLLQQIQSQQASLADSANSLAEERRDIARAQRRDSIFAPIFATVGAILACLLPLLIVWRLLTIAETSQGTEVDLTELLANELVTDRPLLLTARASSDRPGDLAGDQRLSVGDPQNVTVK